MSRSFTAEIVENGPVAVDTNLIKLLPVGPVPVPEPGQFYMLQAGGTHDPLLKRPFCIFDVESGRISFLVKIRGRGTKILGSLASGTRIEGIGPLGAPYPPVDKNPLVVIGGMGVASLLPLIKKSDKGVDVIYGARNKDELLFAAEIESIADTLRITTDDGSEGRKGTVIDAMRESALSEETVVYSCGPEKMLEKVAEVCIERGIECYISLERNMACGLGSCLGCVVGTVSGYQRVCREGPVFSAKDVVWK